MKACSLWVVLFVTAAMGRADYAEDFQAAKALFERKDYEGARVAFERLAAVAPNARGEEPSLSYAALALSRQGEVEQALALAKTIKGRAMAAYTQMEILSDQRDYQGLVDQFKDADIDAWPDRINYLGFQLRGVAYNVIGDRPAAVKDFERCAGLAGSDAHIKLETLNNVGALYHALGDDTRALDAYRRAFDVFDNNVDLKGMWLFPQAILGAAGIRIEQAQYDEAEVLLGEYPINPAPAKRGPWDCLVLEAYGDIDAAKGETEKALTAYRAAAAIDTHQSYMDRVQRKIEALK